MRRGFRNTWNLLYSGPLSEFERLINSPRKARLEAERFIRQNLGGKMTSLLLTSSQTIIVLLLLALVLFGAKRLPDSARSLGRSMRIFKSEMKALEGDDKKEEEEPKA